MTEALAFLAKECGWSHEYIGENFTLAQINKYYETIMQQKMRELQLQGIVFMQAVGTAFGSIKSSDFKRFLDKLTPKMKKQDIDTALEQMKSKGLPIEEN